MGIFFIDDPEGRIHLMVLSAEPGLVLLGGMRKQAEQASEWQP